MKLSRREFLALGAKATAGTMIFAACGLPERELIVQSPVDMPEDLVRGEDAWYATTWPDMPGGDGLIVRVMQGRAKKIAGNPDHPVNLGKQSARHDAAIQLTYHPDRISEPMLRQSKGGLYEPISWQRAEQLMQRAVEAGKDNMSVVTNPLGGHLEWVAINFAALNGGRHIKFDPTEQGVMQDAIRFVYEQEDPPHYDIANANTILSIGADWLSTWQSSVGYSVRYGEFRSKHDRGYLIHAEPRMSMTAANADLWLPVIPGYEGHLAMSMAQVIVDERLAGSGEIARFFNQIPTSSLVGFRPEGRRGTRWRVRLQDSEGGTAFRGASPQPRFRGRERGSAYQRAIQHRCDTRTQHSRWSGRIRWRSEIQPVASFGRRHWKV